MGAVTTGVAFGDFGITGTPVNGRGVDTLPPPPPPEAASPEVTVVVRVPAIAVVLSSAGLPVSLGVSGAFVFSEYAIGFGLLPKHVYRLLYLLL